MSRNWKKLWNGNGRSTREGEVCCDERSCKRWGWPVFLNREPENRYDDQAIAVRTGDGHMIGYVPRDINPVPAVIADQGVILTAEIIRVDLNASPWERVRIRMYQVV